MTPSTKTPRTEESGGTFWNSRFKWLWIIGAVILVLVAAESGGAAGLIAMLALIGAVAAIYTLKTGRIVWTRMASKKAAIVALTSCLVIAVFSSGIATGHAGIDPGALQRQNETWHHPA